MNSSISPSKPLFAVLVGSLVASYIAGVAYTIWINPEIRFWKGAFAAKAAHARALDAHGLPKTVFAGGSSCAFQINPQILENEFGIASVNMGMHAGMGSRAILAMTLAHLKPGDQLVLTLEPSLLTGNLAITPLGFQVMAASGNFQLLSLLPTTHTSSYAEMLVALRPGLRNVVTMLGKVVSGRPSYRYQISDVHYGGYITTEEKGAVAITTIPSPKLSAAAKVFLADLREYIGRRKISGRYLLPWICVQAKIEVPTRDALNSFADDISPFFPQIRDGQDGVDTHIEDFADTSLHMTRDGASRRSESLGVALENLPPNQPTSR